MQEPKLPKFNFDQFNSVDEITKYLCNIPQKDGSSSLISQKVLPFILDKKLKIIAQNIIEKRFNNKIKLEYENAIIKTQLPNILAKNSKIEFAKIEIAPETIKTIKNFEEFLYSINTDKISIEKLFENGVINKIENHDYKMEALKKIAYIYGIPLNLVQKIDKQCFLEEIRKSNKIQDNSLFRIKEEIQKEKTRLQETSDISKISKIVFHENEDDIIHRK